MPTASGTSTAKIIQWGSTDTSIRYFDVYRRADSVTADITTSDICAKVGFGTNHYIDVRENKPEWYWIKAISWAGKSSSFSVTITAVGTVSPTNEPTGFPNITDSVVSYDSATRTLSISPAVTSFSYYINGEKFTKTAADTIQIANSSGSTLIYYNSATLTQEKSPSDGFVSQAIRGKPLVSWVSYSTADGSLLYDGEERHGMTMSGDTHAYLHFANGLAYLKGLGISDISADQSGDLDSHAQFGVESGDVADEDLYRVIGVVSATTGLPILYRDGLLGHWRSVVNAGFSVYNTSATTRLVWNDINSGNWTLTTVDNNDLVLCHVFATTDKNTPMFAIMGQAEYNTVGAARSGATTEVNSLLLSGLSSPEIRPVASIIFQTGNGYNNSVSARIRTGPDGEDYIDWRTTALGRGVAATDHGSLGGLGDDDHNHYLNINGRGGQVIDDAITICGATTINNTLAVTGTVTIDGETKVNDALTVSGSCNVGNFNSLGASQVQGTLEINDEVWVTSQITTKRLLMSEYIQLDEMAEPASPAVDQLRLYAIDSAGTTKLCFKDSGGTVTQVGSGGAGGASVALDNLDTVQINTSLVSDTNNTDDLGSPASYWKALYAHSAFITNLNVSGTAEFTGNVDMNGTLTIKSALVVSDLFVFASSGSFSSAVAINSTLKVTGALTCDSNVVAKSNLSVDGTSTFSGEVTIGNDVTAVGTGLRAMQLVNTWVPGASGVGQFGFWANPIIAPSAQNWGEYTGIGGYASVNNANKVGNNYGLSFAVYNNGNIGTTAIVTINSTAVSSKNVGVLCAGGRGFGSTFKATDFIGLEVYATLNDWGGNFMASASTGILVRNPTDGGSGYLRMNCGIIVEDQTQGNSNNGIVLLGGTAGGTLRFGGKTTGYPALSYDTGTAHICVTNLRNQSGTYYMRWNTSTKEWSYTSSNRDSKTEIIDWLPDCDKILDLRPRKFEYKAELGVEQIGYIAEEVHDIGLTELVDYEDGKPMNVKYDKVSMYLIELVKKQQEQIDKLEERLNGLERI